MASTDVVVKKIKAVVAEAQKFYFEAKKAVVYVAGILTLLLAQGLLSDPYDKYATAFLAIVTGLGIHQVTNRPAGVETPATTP